MRSFSNCCRNNSNCCNNSTSNSKCTCTCVCGDQEVQLCDTSTSSVIKVLLNTVIDSCCKYDEIHKDVIVPIGAGCDLSNICLGTSLEIKVDGEVGCTEVNREMLDGTCLSTVLCNYPVKFIDPCATGCECETPYIKQNFTSLHTVNLACTGNSVLDFQNSRILALSAIVTHIDTDYIVVAVIIGARVCLRQTVIQEHCLTVFPSNTIPCSERTRPDTDCTNCAGTATDTIVSVPVPYRGISTYFGG